MSTNRNRHPTVFEIVVDGEDVRGVVEPFATATKPAGWVMSEDAPGFRLGPGVRSVLTSLGSRLIDCAATTEMSQTRSPM